MNFARLRRLVAVCLIAAVSALATLAAPPAFSADALTPAQQDAVRALVRQYLLDNPEVLVDALNAYQARAQEKARKAQQAALESYSDELENDPTSPVVDAGGNVTIVEFMDYRCGYCKQVFPSLSALIKSDGKIRYVVKEFPILGPDSVIAARAALAVWRLMPDRYFDYHTALMTSRGAFDQKRVLDIATDVGLDAKAIAAEMKNPEIQATIAKNEALARSLDIRGTPAFVINGQLIPGAVDAATLAHLVALARKG